MKLDHQRLEIHWVDSANLFGDRWAEHADINAHQDENLCRTTGYLVGENAHSVYIASSLSPTEIGSVMQIPNSAIRRRTPLKGDNE
jgi:hypothetical protein